MKLNQRKEDVELDMISFVNYPKPVMGRVLIGVGRSSNGQGSIQRANFLLAHLIRKGFVIEFSMDHRIFGGRKGLRKQALSSLSRS